MLKVFKKIGARRIFALVLIVLALVTVLFAVPGSSGNVSASNFAGVVEMWNVECFEGGNGSRASWLTRCASAFEKSHKGVFVHVTTLTPEQAGQKRAQGDDFDVVAFPCGFGYAFADKIVAYGGKIADFLPQFLNAGALDGTQFALPLWSGVYCLFARESQLTSAKTTLCPDVFNATLSRKVGKNTVKLCSLVVGEYQMGTPLVALTMLGKTSPSGSFVVKNQYDAYESFVANKTAITLLGSQRDLYRLSARVDSGKTEKLSVMPLSSFCDLVQFVSVATVGAKNAVATEFVQYLTSEICQSRLNEISMFSALQNVSLYTDKTYADCQNALQGVTVSNAFCGQTVGERRQNALAEFSQ